MTHQSLREEICEAGRRLYLKNYVAAADGNISFRLDDGAFLCTPSGVSKGFMRPEDLVVANAQGEKLAGNGKVSSEFFTHLAAYEERPEARAVIHAHTPYAVALTLAGVSLTRPILPELVAALGGIPTCEYATPGTPEGSAVIRPHIRDADTVLLPRHGAITIGTDVMDALFKMERLEHAAEMIHHALVLTAQISPLSADQIRRLLDTRAPYGATGKIGPIEQPGET